MGKIKSFNNYKLFAGLIYNDEKSLSKALAMLEIEYGNIDFESESFVFDLTEYYNKEMGVNLKRKFVSFEKMVQPYMISGIKIKTNEIESEIADSLSASRRVNIDPGLMSLANIILVSTKDFSHRIPLNNGIYGEITLIYKGRHFEALPWTYPDYKLQLTQEFFKKVRQKMMKEVKAQ